MEYSFRNSKGGEMLSLFLDDYNLILRKGDAKSKKTIAYASILSVRISKASSRDFKIFVYPDGHSPIEIPSHSFSETGELVDQSSGYSLFVRVLHHHLKDKSHAVFASGGDTSKMWQWAVISAALSLVISFTADYLGYSLFNPYMQGLILAGLALIMVLALYLSKLPKTYEPTNIPIQFLP